MHQLFELKGLADEVGRAALDGVDGVLHRAVAGDHDGDDAGIALERRGEDLAAIDAGQAQVRDQDVEGEIARAARALASPDAASVYLEALLGEPFGHDRPQGIFVVDQQQMDGFRQEGQSFGEASIS